MFLFVIPLLAILGRGINLKHDLDEKHLIFALIVMAFPALFVLDHRVTDLEGLILIFLYFLLFYIIQKKHGVFDKSQTEVLHLKAYSFFDLTKVVFGIIVVYLSSQIIVTQTVNFSAIFQIPTFYISLIVLGLGTNLPEISLAIRTVRAGAKDIAFGDYLGSAAANTLLFGFFTLLNEGEVITINSFAVAFAFIVTGFGLFSFFAKSHKDISKKEGVVLLAIYLIFIIYEAGKGILA